jgi:hypothetical protein
MGGGMGEQIITLVKIPIKEIEEWIRTKHTLPSTLSEFHIEENNLVLTFKEDDNASTAIKEQTVKTSKRKRRFRKKRNRMKTRGWKTVARITNSKGQKCTIYKPFVDALQDSKLTPDEQRKTVEKILRANRNKPNETSVTYFLENTLEYLRGNNSHE